ncbi:benzil reductase ((S)-benzoin forming) [Salsuginibacillus halophilus]|uniref:Benzil reductase ((S)-benzoin forming) n=1 Tax=Salsuginibacillus halophilus TaxID=517424 RepID=A0A2P8HXN7_9BACI|nr:(S)-benzoin forming benzil reductase [Salsuginibacillus halophilus]PSL50991.1 benzil reductase ((S)-benzoin forming) [Salsuginibacillus halophilus]
MKHVIVTGASRGIGAAVTQAAAGENTIIHAISRSQNDIAWEKARTQGAEVIHYSCDLTNAESADKTLADIFHTHLPASGDTWVLINNAGMVSPVAPAGQAESNEIQHSLRVNVEAPLLLANRFTQALQAVDAFKMVINVSSGAGKQPITSWSSYCAAKAAVDMYTKTAGLEQKENEHPVYFTAFAPGIVDTDMQSHIRSHSEDTFAHVDQFRAYKENNQLLAPETVAKALLRLIESPPENGALTDVQTYL